MGKALGRYKGKTEALWVGERIYPQITQTYLQREYRDLSGWVLRAEIMRITAGCNAGKASGGGGTYAET